MTDFRRLILVSLLFFTGMMLYNAWVAEHAPATQTTPNSAACPANTNTNINNTTTPVPTAVPRKAISDQYIDYKNNLLDLTFDRIGGSIVSAKLLKYPVSLDDPNTPTVLFNQNPDDYYIATSGILSKDIPSENKIIYNAHIENNKIILTWQNSKILITKVYDIAENNYLINLTQTVTNLTNTNIPITAYAELQRKPVSPKGVGPFNLSTYLGGAISSPQERYEKVTFKNMASQNLNKTTKDGWAAMIQHYFISAWIPEPSEIYHYYSRDNQDIYTLGMQSPELNLEPHATQTITDKLYIGPKISSDLSKIAPGLNLTVDYGILWFIAALLFSVMKTMYKLTGNWGWAIVLVTLFIKILFYKLNSISFRSMAAMRELQPRIEQIRQNCGDDKQKLAKATMELYKREKINPLGGCFPLLVQIPVFLSLYWVIMESVELRQAPFILWIHDLSIKDPYYILPLLMGATIFIQQWLAPKAPDPMQRKLMMAMPFIFTALFLSFPAGLVLYWVVNNTLSITQQYYIMNHVVPRSKKKLAHKKSKKS